MNQESLDKKLSEWLDQALVEYGKAEPRPGIEARTMEHLRGRLSQSAWRRGWQRAAWLSAAAFALVLIMAVLLGRSDKPPAPDRAGKSDQELLIGVERLLNQEVPAALEPALMLTQEMVKK